MRCLVLTAPRRMTLWPFPCAHTSSSAATENAQPVLPLQQSMFLAAMASSTHADVPAW